MPETYHLTVAQNRVHQLREKVIREVARAIAERGWTQAQTAVYLGVRQPRISNLVRGQTHKFTLDALIEMLFALDRPVEVVMQDPKTWSRSPTWRTDPDDPEALDTVAHYTAVIHHDPRNAIAYSRRASAYHRLGQYDLAIGDYTRGLEIQPQNPGTLANRSLVYQRAGQYAAALLDCEEIIRRFPDYNVYQNRSLLYMELEDYDKAMEDMDRAVQLDPQIPGPWTNRGLLHRKMGHVREALADYQKSLEIDPTSQQARAAVAELDLELSGEAGAA